MTEETKVVDPQVLEDFLKEEMPTDEEMAADFAIGFSGREPGAKKEVKQEAEQEAKQETKKEEKLEDKPDSFNQIATKLDSLDANFNKRIRHIEGRFGDLNAKLQSLSKPHTENKEPPKLSNEKLDHVKNEYSDMGFAEAVEEQVKNLENKFADQYGDLPKKVKEEVSSEIREMLNDTLIEFRHKGWKERIKTDKFASWYDKQEESVQNLAHSDKLYDAIELLDKFAVDVNESGSPPESEEKIEKKPDSKKARLAAAVAPETKGARNPPAVRTEEDDFREGFNS